MGWRLTNADWKRELRAVAAVTVTVALIVSGLWLWFGGIRFLPGVIRNLPFALLISGTITAASTVLCTIAARRLRDRPAPIRWSGYLAAMAAAAVIGTWLTPLILSAFQVMPFAEVGRNFLQNIKMTLPVSLVAGSLIMVASDGRAKVEAVQAQRRAPAKPPRLASRVGGKIEFVDLGSVSYVYAQDKLTFAVTPAKHHPLDLSIAELEEKLATGDWIRIHRSTLVNAEAVRELRTNVMGRLFVRLDDGAELAVARDRAAQVRARLKP